VCRKALIATVAMLFGLFVCAGTALPQRVEKENDTPAGVWDMRGVDRANTHWLGTMVIAKNRYGNLKGHITMLSSDGHFEREHITGNYDDKTRVLKFAGTELEFANRLARATYRAVLTRDGSALSRGTWTHNDPTILGSRKAERICLR
jgi:hypothetical protein